MQTIGDNILRMLKQYEFLCMICIVTVMHLFDLMDISKDCIYYRYMTLLLGAIKECFVNNVMANR